MAAPLDPTVPSNSDSPSLGDDEIRALKQFQIDAFGFPVSPSALLSPVTSIAPDGTATFARGLILPDIGNPVLAGQIQRAGSSVLVNNGISSGSFPLVLDKGNSPITATTVGPTTLVLEGLGANILGTSGRARLTAIGRVNIRATHSVTITAAIAGLSNLASLTLVGGSTTNRTALSLELSCEIWMNGAANSSRAKLKGEVTQSALGTDSPGWGASGGSNLGMNLVDSTVDMSVARNLQLFANWSNADAANSLTLYQFLLVLFN